MEELDVRGWFVLTGLVVGLLYGVVAQSTAFCVRRGISDLAEGKGHHQMLGVSLRLGSSGTPGAVGGRIFACLPI